MMAARNTAEEYVAQMLAGDPFSRWLGIAVRRAEAGSVELAMTVRPEMLNGFGVCHGGVTFAFADSALAFASNSHGRLSLLIDAGMSYPAAVSAGERLTAVAEEVSLSNKIGIYQIRVNNDRGEVVGLFKGTVYRTSKSL